MPGPNPLSTKNAPLSPAVSALGLGDQLVSAVQDKVADIKRAKGQAVTGMGMYSPLGASPSVAALGLMQNA